jgi:preprotein translocase subunit Sec61beta
MEALNAKEKIGVTLLIGGMASMFVGGAGLIFSETEETKLKMRRTIQVGAGVAMSGFIYLSILGSKR